MSLPNSPANSPHSFPQPQRAEYLAAGVETCDIDDVFGSFAEPRAASFDATREAEFAHTHLMFRQMEEGATHIQERLTDDKMGVTWTMKYLCTFSLTQELVQQHAFDIWAKLVGVLPKCKTWPEMTKTFYTQWFTIVGQLLTGVDDEETLDALARYISEIVIQDTLRPPCALDNILEMQAMTTFMSQPHTLPKHNQLVLMELTMELFESINTLNETHRDASKALFQTMAQLRETLRGETNSRFSLLFTDFDSYYYERIQWEYGDGNNYDIAEEEQQINQAYAMLPQLIRDDTNEESSSELLSTDEEESSTAEFNEHELDLFG